MQDADNSDTRLRGEAQIAFARDALRGIVILNGGAIIALLTFFGQAWSKNEAQARVVILFLREGLILFVFGSVCGIAAQGFAYLAQQSFVEERRWGGRIFRGLCILLGILGIVFFAWGCWASIDGILAR
jgi:hypothetical protein